MITVAFLYAVLASTFIFAKKALAYARPFFLIGTRMLIAGSFLLGYQYFFNRKNFRIKKEDLWTFFRVSLYHVYFAYMLEFWALQYVSALKTTIIYSATPFIAAILAYFLLHERLSIRKVLGVIIGLCGIIPALLAQATGVEATLELHRISLPEVILLFAVISASYAWFIVSDLMKKNYSFGFINGVAMFAGGALSMITAVFTEGLASPVSHVGPFLGWLALLILCSNIIFYNLFSWLLKRYSITFLTFAGFLCPSFATLYEWLFMGGTITWHYFASLVLIILGLYIFYKDELKNIRAY